MSRHQFRSQPALQRSGGHGPPAIIGLGLLAAVGIVGGALIGNLARGPAPATDGTWNAGPTDQPAAVASAPPLAAAPAVSAASPAQIKPGLAKPGLAKPGLAALAQTAPPAPLVRAHAVASPKRPRPVRAARVAAAEPAPAQVSPEQQQADYRRARAAYDADERTAGFRWAQQNNIRIRSYCHIAAQRTPAFQEGCMNYLRPKHDRAGDQPAEAPVSHQPGQG
jgi:hypothetical protein